MQKKKKKKHQMRKKKKQKGKNTQHINKKRGDLDSDDGRAL